MLQGFEECLVASAGRALITACGRGSWDEKQANRERVGKRG